MNTEDHTDLGGDKTTNEHASSLAEVLEEVRQLRASLKVYRHIVDRLLTEPMCSDCERRKRLKR